MRNNKIDWTTFEKNLKYCENLYEIASLMCLPPNSLTRSFEIRYNVKKEDFKDFRIKYLKDLGIQEELIPFHYFKEIDWDYVKKCLEARTDYAVIARHFRTTVHYLNKLCIRDLGKELVDLAKECEKIGNDNIKLKIYDLALNNNEKMLTLLAKNWLKLDTSSGNLPKNFDEDLDRTQRIQINIITPQIKDEDLETDMTDL